MNTKKRLKAQARRQKEFAAQSAKFQKQWDGRGIEGIRFLFASISSFKLDKANSFASHRKRLTKSLMPRMLRKSKRAMQKASRKANR